ncbi:hypothetical protein FB446DRAFT_742671 [Lentinula raphanica]|nr:hypothetical protein FB446DRAFT_742671 [Lentinula raphanica]
MYPKHLAFTVFFTLGIFPSISMGAPVSQSGFTLADVADTHDRRTCIQMGNVNAEIIEGRAVKVIAASARPVSMLPSLRCMIMIH